MFWGFTRAHASSLHVVMYVVEYIPYKYSSTIYECEMSIGLGCPFFFSTARVLRFGDFF